MSLSANTHRSIVWTVRVLLAMAFGVAGAAKVAANYRSKIDLP